MTEKGDVMHPSLLTEECRQAGRNIRNARDRQGWTQQQLATQAGVGLQTVVRLEQGHPGVSTLNVRKVLHALQLVGPSAEELAQAASQGPTFPLHERHLDSTETQEALEAAAKAACEVLDEWLGVEYVERDGITSNFQGMLKAHLAAMVCGRPHGREQSYLPRLVYSDDWLHERPSVGKAFGWVLRFCSTQRILEGWTLRADRTQCILDEGRVLSLTDEDVNPFTSAEAACEAFRRHIERHGHPDAAVEVVPVYLSATGELRFEPAVAE